MADLILSKQTMSSLEIAELTGKQHAHVMRDIRNLLEQGVSESNFGLSSYNQPQPNGGYKKGGLLRTYPKGLLFLHLDITLYFVKRLLIDGKRWKQGKQSQ